MRDNNGYFIQGDLQKVMEEEAREENQAEAEAAYYDAISDTDDIEALQAERDDLSDSIRSVETEITGLERELEKLRNERDTKEKRKQYVERRIMELDPEYIVEVSATESRRYGWVTVLNVEKHPPIPGHVFDEDPKVGATPASETIANSVSEFCESVDADDYADGEVIAQLRFDDLEDNDPEILRGAELNDVRGSDGDV